jgi:site-specific recombinase
MFTKHNTLPQTLQSIADYEGEELDLLADLISNLRPTKRQLKLGLVPGFDSLLLSLQTNEKLRIGLQDYLSRLLVNRQFSSSLTDANIITGLDFLSELRKRIVHKFLPFQPEKDTLEYLLVNVFYLSTDANWVNAIPNEKAKIFIELLGFDGLFERNVESSFIKDVLFAVMVITHRLTGNAFDAEVMRMVPNYQKKDSPFAALQDEIDSFLKGIQTGSLKRTENELQFKHIQVLIDQCHIFIESAYKNKSDFGISFHVHQQLMVILTLLDRLKIILNLFVKQENEDSKTELIVFAKALVYINSGKSQISGYINKSTQLMAHEITQNTGKAGEHYITGNWKEYKGMLYSALGGGAIVAVACIVKMEMSGIKTSLFGQGFLYSLNYAIAFITIYLLHYTLATKQPAMTAATLAKEVEQDLKQKNNYYNLAEIFARVFRSQFIAFVGNVFMAFPVALFLIYIWSTLAGHNLAAHKAPTLIKDLNFLKTPLILHSAIAGVFLFLSGLIAGAVHNKTKYKRVPARIVQHPILKRIMSNDRRQKLANFYENNMGGIASNFWFGLFLGFTHMVGIILGLDLDIRHITFAAGNFGLGLFGLNYQLSLEVILMSIFGIGLIGFVNFIVSFTLSLSVALRSRAIPLNALWSILVAIKNRFIFQPWSFFFPPKES